MADDKHDRGGQPAEPPEIRADPPPPGESSEEQGQTQPGGQRGTKDLFTGRAAQLAVMAELLRLRCNAAIPEVDMGTDVFAFKDDREEVVRLQVKACTTPHDYADGSGYSAKFALPMKQLMHLEDRPPLYYVLAAQRDGKWIDFLVVSRAELQSYYNGMAPFGSLRASNSTYLHSQSRRSGWHAHVFVGMECRGCPCPRRRGHATQSSIR